MRWVLNSGIVAGLLGVSSAALGADAGGATEGSTAGVSSSAGGSTSPSADRGVQDSSSSAERDWVGIDVGVRVGFAMPFGDLATVDAPPFPQSTGVGSALFSGEQALRDTLDGHVPIQLDLGYRITDSLVVGAYGLWGSGVLAGKSPFSCDDRARAEFTADAEAEGDAMADGSPMDEPGEVPELACSASVIRAGVQVRYHFQPHDDVDPWLGLGSGLEITTIDSGDLDTSLSFSGFEFVNINAGLDIELLDDFRVGPYGQFAVGRYGKVPDASDVHETRYQCPGPNCALEDDAVDTAGAHFWATGGLRTSYVF